MNVPFHPYLRLALWTAFAANLGMFPLAIFRIREQVKAYSIATLIAFALQAALTLTFVLVLHAGPAGMLAGMLLSAAIMAVGYVVIMLHEVRFSFTWRHLMEPLRYSLPTVPAAILDGVSSIFDRYFLDRYVSLAQLGLYNIGNQFGSAFNMFNQMLKTSWVPFLYRVVTDRGDGSEILSRFAVYYLALLTVPALAVALLSKELIELIGQPRFAGVYHYIPAFVGVYYLQAIISAMGRGMDLAKNNVLLPLVWTIAIAVSIAALAILVPRWGAYGALVALAITAGVRILMQVSISLYYYPRPLHLAKLTVIWSLSLLAFLVGHWGSPTNLWLGIMFKCAIVAALALVNARVAVGPAAWAAWVAGRRSALAGLRKRLR